MTTFHPTHGRTFAAVSHTDFRNRTLMRALLGTSALILALAAWPAAAAPNAAPDTAGTTDLAQTPAGKTAAFDIPAQALPTALNAFGRQAGVQITVDAALTQGRQAPAVNGVMTAAEALNRLLTGTGIIWTFSAPKTVALSRPDASGARITLGTVSVEGRAQPHQSQIGNLPPEYAGGQVARGGSVGVLGNKDMMDTPFTQNSYTSKLIQNQQNRDISDTVRNDPSIGISTPAHYGGSSFSIRGFDIGNYDILFNGVPNVAPTQVTSMSAESIERVEVLRGASGLLKGMAPGESISGVVNVVPKRAGDDPFMQFTPDYTGTSNFGGHVDLGHRFGTDKEFGVRFNGVYRDGDMPIDHQSQETRLAAFGLDYRHDRFRVDADIGYQRNRVDGARQLYQVSTGVAVPDAPDAATNPNAPWEFIDNEVYYGTLRGEVDVTPDITAFAAVGGHRRHMARQVFLTRTINNSDGDLSAGNVTQRGEALHAFSTNAGARAEFQTGPVDHQAVVGFDFTTRVWLAARGSHSVVASNLYDPTFSSAPQSGLPSPSDAQKQQDNWYRSYVLADTLSVLDGMVQVTGGARYQEINTTSFNRNTEAATGGFADDAITPMAALVVKPWGDQVSFYASYIEGLQSGSTAPDDADNAGEAFPPYVTKQYEAGTKWDMGRMTATLTAYQIAEPSAFTDPDTNIYSVDGEQRHRGLDLNLFGEPADGIRVLGGVSYIDSELTEAADPDNVGNAGVGAPKWRFVLGGEWDLPQVDGLTLTGRVTHQTSTFRDTANLQKIDGHSRVDIGARYTIKRQGGQPVVVRASIENLFNESFWGVNTAGQMHIGDPRTYKLSASFDF
tara:strand:+ start:2038 stop:4563 length:2526 start_codon:yes stop_codon:yes gene_type:complete